jgi:Mitochondrial degradasome RNA helicase subunit C terminal
MPASVQLWCHNVKDCQFKDSAYAATSLRTHTYLYQDLYIWLGTRNKREFVDLELARQGALCCSQAINTGLANMLPPAPPAAARSRKAMLRDFRASTAAAAFSAKSARKGSKGRRGGTASKREREGAVSFL